MNPIPPIRFASLAGRVWFALTSVSAPVFATSLLPSATHEETALTAVPVIAHWRFQDGIEGGVATALIRDSGKHSRQGRPIGGPRYAATPLATSNLGLVFDGADDRIRFVDDPLFHLCRSMTLEASIRVDRYADSAGKLRHVIFRGDDRFGFDPWFLAVAETGQLVFAVTDALNHQSKVLSSSPLPLGTFVHVAARLNAETGEQSVFLDGVCVGATETEIRSCGPLGGVRPGVAIGGRQGPSDQGFCGVIAEVRIAVAALHPERFLTRPGATRSSTLRARKERSGSTEGKGRHAKKVLGPGSVESEPASRTSASAPPFVTEPRPFSASPTPSSRRGRTSRGTRGRSIPEGRG